VRGSQPQTQPGHDDASARHRLRSAGSMQARTERAHRIDAALRDALLPPRFADPAVMRSWPSAATAGIVIDGTTVYCGGAGVCDDGVDCGTCPASVVFVTASISKTFLAALALQSHERAELDLDADINQVLARPDCHHDRVSSNDGPCAPPALGMVCNPHFPGATVTARQLLTHRSGLLDDESNLEHGSAYRWAAGATSAVSLASYVQRELATSDAGAEGGSGGVGAAIWSSVAPPGQAAYHYSNAGFALLGLVLERAAGTPLPQLARTRLFAPLAMHSTAYFLSELQRRRPAASGALEVDADQPDGVGRSPCPASPVGGGSPLRFAAPRGQPEQGGHYEVAEYPAAQVRSTVADLCRWLEFLTGELQPERAPTPAPEPAPEPEPETAGPPSRQPAMILSPASLALMLPRSGRESLAWWGLDAQYSEKQAGQFGE
jgi:CubicO group peptidase (beta-lactamase class C family)